MIFGQLGNDVIQGDGGIEGAFAAIAHAGASRTPDGATGTVSDLVGDLTWCRRSRRRPTARTTSKAAAATTSSSAAWARTTSSAAAPTSSAW